MLPRTFGRLLVVTLLVPLAREAVALPPILPPPPQSCSVDADCDDGLFCNGPETCETGFCATGSSPCRGLSCSEDLLCAGRPLLAVSQGQMAWHEDATLDPELRLGLGAFQPSTGRLFDERTYTPADVGTHFVATLGSDPDFAAFVGELSNGEANKVGICRETFVGGMTSQATCEPTPEQDFFGLDSTDFAFDEIGRIDLVIDSLTFTPTTGTQVSVFLRILVLPEPDAGSLEVFALGTLFALAESRRRQREPAAARTAWRGGVGRE